MSQKTEYHKIAAPFLKILREVNRSDNPGTATWSDDYLKEKAMECFDIASNMAVNMRICK